MMPIVSVHIVVWNSMPFLSELLASLEKQTYKNIQILVIDNGSTDRAQVFVSEQYPSVRYLRNVRNLGVCAAHNQGIRYVLEHWREEDPAECFVLFASPNMILAPTCIEELVHTAKQHPEAATVGAKQLRAYAEQTSDDFSTETVRSERIESVGYELLPSFRVRPRAAGQLDEGQADEAMPVFSQSSALVLTRLEALLSIADQETFFDPDFFVSQEEVDLAFRFQMIGWSSWVQPRAVGYHHRGHFEPSVAGLLAKWKHRRAISPQRRFFALRNHLLLLLKYLDAWTFVFAFPRWFFGGLGLFLQVLFIEPKQLRVFVSVITLIPRIWRHRQVIAKTRRVTTRQIRKQFCV